MSRDVAVRGNGKTVLRGKLIEAAQDARLFSAMRSLFSLLQIGCGPHHRVAHWAGRLV